MQDWRRIIEAAVGRPRFSGPRLTLDLFPRIEAASETRDLLKAARGILGEGITQLTVMGVVRAVFLFEPVNKNVTSTKFEHRWAARLVGDPRYCSFDDCTEIFIGLLERLAAEAGARRDLLTRFQGFRSLAYEVPVDYLERGPGHRPGNVGWIWDKEEIEQTLLLRELVSDTSVVGSEVEAFQHARKKIGVKTYLTDRALTGAYKTNREKRWEAHPEGVQFAFRRDCLRIEHKLLSQICYFDSFPSRIRERITAARAILRLELPARCPITRDPLDYPLLVESLKSPEWGRSAFQVGHLNPLKGPGSGSQYGHTPANVAWISADGNRIQGHLSYAEVRQLLDRIRSNYEQVDPAPEIGA